ncbi:DUF6417 family protein [Streptomyces sp. NPDC017435]|uniref:DUF6417 family protein n=1 Tax=Streptomyces sp. NPDC017435 TaxID=3364995 RepID=UPI003797FA95
MDDYEHLDFDEIDFAPVEHDVKRVRLLTLDEAHDLLRVHARHGTGGRYGRAGGGPSGT